MYEIGIMDISVSTRKVPEWGTFLLPLINHISFRRGNKISKGISVSDLQKTNKEIVYLMNLNFGTIFPVYC